MLDYFNIPIIISYIVYLVILILFYGISSTLIYARFKVKKSPFYTKMLQQWTPFFSLFWIFYILSSLFFSFSSYSPLAARLPKTITTVIIQYSVYISITIATITTFFFYSKRKRLISFKLYLIPFITTLIFMITSHHKFVGYFFLAFPLPLILYVFILGNMLCLSISFMRQKKDNFGRDYYIFASRFCIQNIYLASFALFVCYLEAINFFTPILYLLVDGTITQLDSFDDIYGVIGQLRTFFTSLYTTVSTLLQIPLFFIYYKIHSTNVNPLQYKVSIISMFLISLLSLIIFIVCPLILQNFIMDLSMFSLQTITNLIKG